MNRRGFTTMLAGLCAALLVPALAPSVARADQLAEARASGQLRIAMSGQYPPFNFVDRDNQLVGLDVDLARGLCARMGLEAQLVTTAWDGILAGLIAGRYDAIIGSMTITEARRKAVDFVGPYYHAGRAVFVPEASAAQSLADLAGARVGATLGETHERWARAQPGWKVRSYKGLAETLLEVSAGRLDAIVNDDVAVWPAIKSTGARLRQLPAPGIEDARTEIGIAIRKDQPALHAALTEALAAMKADGSFAAMAHHWVGAELR